MQKLIVYSKINCLMQITKENIEKLYFAGKPFVYEEKILIQTNQIHCSIQKEHGAVRSNQISI